MVKVIDGQIVAYSLPETGILKDGRTVSGYNLLPETVLKAEGWLPLINDPPTYDQATQTLMQKGYSILHDRVLVEYEIQTIQNNTESAEALTQAQKIAKLEQENSQLFDALLYLLYEPTKA